jgi:cell division protein FtsB
LTALNASLGAANTSLEEQVASLQAEHFTQVQTFSAERDSLLAQVADLTDVVSGARKLKAALESLKEKARSNVEKIKI